MKKLNETAAAQAAENTVEAIAREWYAKRLHTWATGHAKTIIRRLERDVFPWLGGRPVAEVTPPELLTVLRRVESRGALETAHRIHQVCGLVFRYAVATGRAVSDPCRDLRGALPPANPNHHSAITDSKAVGDLLRAIEGYKGTLPTKCALRLAPLLFVRPGELRHAEWAEIDLDAAEWRIPAEKMKLRRPHIVPLPRQAVAILRELAPLTGLGRYVFPGVRSAKRPMSANTVNAALRRLGYDKETMTGHGFRAMASTILNEQGWNRDVIERQLAHAERSKVRAAYNHAEYLGERRQMMQSWADYLDGLATGANVVPIRRGA
jgi:integrase